MISFLAFRRYSLTIHEQEVYAERASVGGPPSAASTGLNEIDMMALPSDLSLSSNQAMHEVSREPTTAANRRSANSSNNAI